MEGHTRLLQLMHDAFSTQQREAFTEPNGKQKRPLKNFGILDDIYKYCGFGERTPAEAEKFGLDTQIKALYKRKAAAAELLDAIEGEIGEIEKVIDDRKQHRERVLRSIGVTSGFMGSLCNSCCDDADRDEIDRRVSGRDAGQIELRSDLKKRLEEVQLDLTEKTHELNNLKHELGIAAAKAAPGQGNRAVSAKEAKERILRHYAGQFAGNMGQLKQMVFLSWKTFVKSNTTKDKAMKKGALGFALLMKNGVQAICFTAWRDFQKGNKDKAGRRQERMMTYYASKFAGVMGAGASLKLCFDQWWKYVKENK